MKPTWAEVKARSVGSWNGLETYCGDCGMAWEHNQLPCRKHATSEESALIDECLAQALENLADHPMLKAITRRGKR
jgi:hypothetical protein